MDRHLAAFLADARRTYEYHSGGRLRRILACAAAPGVQAMAVYRYGQWLKTQPLLLRLAMEPDYALFSRLVQVLWGIELPRDAKIGPGLYIGHFGGITVSSEAVIGANCNISQNITIGLSGKGERRGVPVIGNDVYIAPGARLFGRIRIGDNAVIGANAVVYRDVPGNAVVVLDPGFRIKSMRGNRSGPPAKRAA
jgi:serine O-acetyltransferase